ncbi:hypothetical protein HW555_003749 [Spodoptera exigua]|uniref:Peptidase S1 domain-containing protein n=1 Tax=Spodoptera exigua TaxID=7107 RepID=A0A835GKR9_SPOEX|nr:hypothetical protein HW555_003749 [Spodoptera exigua]
MAVPGAPMVVGGHLTGILSWGFGCGYDYDLPLIYTNVLHFQQWLVHNFKIFRGITTKNLTLFFEATRASRLAMWLKLTRIEPPTPFVVPNKPMEIMQIDKILAKLRGRVLDIRDYLYDGIHRTYKRKLYEKIRGMMYMKKTTHANFTYNPLEPFLNPIITQNMDNVTTSKPTVTLNVADSDFDEY